MKQILNQIKPFAIVVIIILILQAGGLWGNVQSAAQSVILKTGLLNAETEFDRTPETFDYGFDLVDLQGNHRSASDLKGKVVFLNLWATWCGPCKAEMPGIHSLYQKMQGQPVEFVMLSVDRGDAREKVKSYLSKNNYTFPVYMLKSNPTELLQVPSIPTTFIINKEGKIVSKEVGTKNYNTSKMVKSLTALAAQ